jgi:hypothetical protein
LIVEGGGAMVAIDFEDGSSALVSGLDETLKELGLVQDEGFIVTKQESDREILTSNVAAADKKSTALVVGLERDDENEIVSIEVLENFAPENYPQTPIEKKLDHGAVDRMRAETTNNNILVNPWLDAASYLAKKAGEKIFRKGD